MDAVHAPIGHQHGLGTDYAIILRREGAHVLSGANRFGYRGLNRHQVRTSSQKFTDRNEILGPATLCHCDGLGAQCFHEQPVVAHLANITGLRLHH